MRHLTLLLEASGETNVVVIPIFAMVTAEQVEGSAIDRGGSNDVIAAFADVEHGKKFAACPEEVSIAADPPSIAAIFAATMVVGRILKAGVKITICL